MKFNITDLKNHFHSEKEIKSMKELRDFIKEVGVVKIYPYSGLLFEGSEQTYLIEIQS